MAHPAPEEQFHRQRVRTAFVSVTVSMALVLFVVGVMASLLLQARELGRELQENFTFTAFLVPETDAAEVFARGFVIDRPEAVAAHNPVAQDPANGAPCFIRAQWPANEL